MERAREAAGEVVLLPRNDLHLVGSDLNLPPMAGAISSSRPRDGGLFTDPLRRRRSADADGVWVPRRDGAEATR